MESQARLFKMRTAAVCFVVPGVFLRASLGLLLLATLSILPASAGAQQPDPAPAPAPVTPDLSLIHI